MCLGFLKGYPSGSVFLAIQINPKHPLSLITQYFLPIQHTITVVCTGMSLLEIEEFHLSKKTK